MIGENPDMFFNMTREGLVEELRRAVNELDHGLTEAKREILREITGVYLLSQDEDRAAEQAMINDLCSRMNGEGCLNL